MIEKYLWKSSIFRNVTGCDNFSKVSLHFTKMSNYSQKKFVDIIENMFFLCDTIYRFPAAVSGGALKVLGKSLVTILDEVLFIVDLYSFPQLSHLPLLS